MIWMPWPEARAPEAVERWLHESTWFESLWWTDREQNWTKAILGLPAIFRRQVVDLGPFAAAIQLQV